MPKNIEGRIYTDVNYCLLTSQKELDPTLLMQGSLSPEFKSRLEKALFASGGQPFPKNLEQFVASLVDEASHYSPRGILQNLGWNSRSIVSRSTMDWPGNWDYKTKGGEVREYAGSRIAPFSPNTELMQSLSQAADNGYKVTILSNLSYLARGALMDSLGGFKAALNPEIMAVLRPTGLRSSPGLKVATVAFSYLGDGLDQSNIWLVDDDPLIVEEVDKLGVCRGFYIPRTREQLRMQPLLQQQALERIRSKKRGSRVIIRGDESSVEAEIDKMLSR